MENLLLGQMWDAPRVVIRLLLVVLCGGLIGIERGRRGRPAGFRTHVLVCLGSALTVMTNEFIFLRYGAGDPTRMAAQVISGIGFLGAGTILVTGSKKVQGLTTAASLWASACLGLAVGAGFYTAAIVGTLLILAVNSLLYRLDESIHGNAMSIMLYAELTDISVVRRILDFTRQRDMKLSEISLVKQEALGENIVGMTANLQLAKSANRQEVYQEMNGIEGIDFLEFLHM